MFAAPPIGISRRALLKDAACGFGYLAFAGLASRAAAAGPGPDPLAARPPQFAPRALRVIFMFMHGGPSQVDTFDYKPTLARYSGRPAPFVKASAGDPPPKKEPPLL